VLATYLGALGLEAGLSAHEMHTLNDKLFCNDALAAVSTTKLSTSYTTATALEAAVGAAACISHLLPVLSAAVGAASQELLANIQAEVAAKALCSKRKRDDDTAEDEGAAQRQRGHVWPLPKPRDIPPALHAAPQGARPRKTPPKAAAQRRKSLAAKLAHAESVVARLREQVMRSPRRGSF
jgi:hypothetical protein